MKVELRQVLGLRPLLAGDSRPQPPFLLSRGDDRRGVKFSLQPEVVNNYSRLSRVFGPFTGDILKVESKHRR
jgi:hypothetical protein